MQNKIDERLPRHIQIKDELMRRIVERVWKAGDALPSEDKLADEFQVSVGTLRKAVQALAHDGIVERIHGKGTYVTRAYERSSMLRFVRFRGSRTDEVPTARILDMRTDRTTDVIREKLGLGKAGKALYIHRTRTFGDQILLIEHIWLPLPLFAKLVPYLKKENPPLLYPAYDAVCEVVVARAVDELSIGALSDEDASILGLPKADSCMNIDRTMHDHAGNVVEWRTSVVPKDRFHYTVEIK